MKYALIAIAIVLGLVGVGAVAYWLSVPQLKQRPGFDDWVKNPEYRRAAAEQYLARESLEVPDDISAKEIKAMVDGLYVPQDADFNLDRLKLVGTKAVPYLISALEDPKTRTAKFDRDLHPVEAESPFERICEVLASVGSPLAALPLAPYAQHPDSHFRRWTARTLGSIGSAECIEPMLRALDDNDDDVRSDAIIGIEQGMDANRCTNDFLHAMFPALAKLLDRHQYAFFSSAPALMLAIDSGRAVPVLLSNEYFTIDNRELHHIIEALNAVGQPIPHEKLLPLLAAVRPHIEDYPHDYEYADALRAYAFNPDAAAEGTIRAALDSPNDMVREAAAESLGILSGVTDPAGVVFTVLEQRGLQGLSAPQKTYFAVYTYDGEVNNGGHSQFFVNSSGDHWRAALEGLPVIGAQERSGLLREAVALFGADGPPEDNATRHRQLAGFSQNQDDMLDSLDKRYYSCDENVSVLLSLYAIENKEHFILRE